MPSGSIQLVRHGQRFPFYPIRLIKIWLQKLAEQEGHCVGQIIFNCGTDDALLKINQQFLQHDTFTDIITFDYSEQKNENCKELIGEVFISIPRVRDNARSYSKGSFQLELLRVLAHGTLHLCGFRDKKALEKKEMKQKENEALDLFHRLQREYA
jgi:rRNA maturation RNase YbeY